MEPAYDDLGEGDLIAIADAVLGEAVIADVGLLVSALDRPWITVLGEAAYPELVDQAAALMQSLARNGPLVSGNEAVAWAATRVFCLLNGHDLICEVEVAEALVLAIARGEVDTVTIAGALRRHLR